MLKKCGLISPHPVKKSKIALHLTKMNCTPIVRHSLTIGGAVFLWLNLQLMKKYKSFYVI
ncbi:hypothetical protein BLX06_22065 [Bacillus cereus]|uniref:Uncharacterized protein n=1 Tax=Bacillus cereus TaxID=1396 RepID=A0A9X6GDZ2_BACCE|nr:hypothetical protein BLX06_22065 [Bacillus cereus]